MKVILVLVLLTGLPQDADLSTRTDEAVAANKYDDALGLISDAEKSAIKVKDTEAVLRLRDRKKEITALKAEYSKVKEQDAKLLTNPEDPDANAAMGRFYCFVREDWAKGLPHLAKGSDQFLKALADQELAKSAKGEDKASIGDGWWTGSTQVQIEAGLTGATATAKVAIDKEATKRAKFRMMARAVYWYQQAWPLLKEVDREKLRPKFRALYLNPASQDPKGLREPNGWTCPHKEQNAGSSARAVHSGKSSWQVTCGKNSLERYPSLLQVFQVQPGKSYEFSCWALTDGTEAANDEINFPVFSSDGKLIHHPLIYLPVDCPYWQRLEVKFVPPDGSSRITMTFLVTSKKGTIFLDDWTLKCEGKEILKNPGFEDH